MQFPVYHNFHFFIHLNKYFNNVIEYMVEYQLQALINL